MRKILFYFLLFIVIFSSCKKEEESECPKCGPPVVEHNAYVRGYVFDSVTGSLAASAKLYHSYALFSGDPGYPTSGGMDSTDASGMYTRKVGWVVGDLFHNGTTQSTKPDDSADVYVNIYTSNFCGFIKFKGWQLIENDTTILPSAYIVKDGYIKTHIKDTIGGPALTNLQWYYLINYSFKTYGPNTDTLITFRACPYQKIYFSNWGSDSVSVSSGDTALVDVFY